jgi:LPS sulfotransferase NodH
MSFTIRTQHADLSDEAKHFDQMQDLLAYITERLAVWNNFEVENGLDWLEITVTKPEDPAALGIHIEDEMKLADRMG